MLHELLGREAGRAAQVTSAVATHEGLVDALAELLSEGHDLEPTDRGAARTRTHVRVRDGSLLRARRWSVWPYLGAVWVVTRVQLARVLDGTNEGLHQAQRVEAVAARRQAGRLTSQALCDRGNAGPRGLARRQATTHLVSSPRKCACHKSATVPCDASNLPRQAHTSREPLFTGPTYVRVHKQAQPAALTRESACRPQPCQ